MCNKWWCGEKKYSPSLGGWIFKCGGNMRERFLESTFLEDQGSARQRKWPYGKLFSSFGWQHFKTWGNTREKVVEGDTLPHIFYGKMSTGLLSAFQSRKTERSTLKYDPCSIFSLWELSIELLLALSGTKTELYTLKNENHAPKILQRSHFQECGAPFLAILVAYIMLRTWKFYWPLTFRSQLIKDRPQKFGFLDKFGTVHKKYPFW